VRSIQLAVSDSLNCRKKCDGCNLSSSHASSGDVLSHNLFYLCSCLQNEYVSGHGNGHLFNFHMFVECFLCFLL
jgi:hypothetical protein